MIIYRLLASTRQRSVLACSGNRRLVEAASIEPLSGQLDTIAQAHLWLIPQLATSLLHAMTIIGPKHHRAKLCGRRLHLQVGRDKDPLSHRCTHEHGQIGKMEGWTNATNGIGNGVEHLRSEEHTSE